MLDALPTKARRPRRPVELPADAQPVQWLQPDANPGGDGSGRATTANVRV